MRKLLLPPFHGEAIKTYEQLIRKIAVADVERWPTGTPLRSRDHTQAITLEVILRAVFGIEDAERLHALKVLIPRVIEANPFVLFTKRLQIDLGRRSPWNCTRPCRDGRDHLRRDPAQAQVRRRGLGHPRCYSAPPTKRDSR